MITMGLSQFTINKVVLLMMFPLRHKINYKKKIDKGYSQYCQLSGKANFFIHRKLKSYCS